MKPNLIMMFGIIESELEEWEAGEMCRSEEMDMQKGIRSRGHIQQIDRHSQCLNCCFTNTRRCAYHGYPEDKIPVWCMYKMGTSSFEAQENLQGTFIEWNQLKEHDAVIEAKAREAVLDEIIAIATRTSIGCVFPEKECAHEDCTVCIAKSLRSEVKMP